MTVRVKPEVRAKRRTHWENEERHQFWVTVGFIALIAVALLVLAAAAAFSYYDQHFRPVARVGGAEISRDQLSERSRLESFRARRQEARIRQMMAAGELDPVLAQAQLQEVAQREQDAQPRSLLERLVDQKLQASLAGQEGVSVTDADADAQVAKETAFPERRRVSAVIVEPERGEAGGEPTKEQQDAARKKAEQALADLKAGRPFHEVAAKYSTDPSRDRGGQLGGMTQDSPGEERFRTAVFQLPSGGLTDVVEGTDGVYRVGQVTEILPAHEDPAYLQELQQEVPVATFRQAVRDELTVQRLEETVVGRATTGQVEQVRAGRIILPIPAPPDAAQGEGPGQGDVASPAPAAAEPEVRARHILYKAEGDQVNPETGEPQPVPEDDPAWQAVQKDAERAAKELRSITDVARREQAFAGRARKESDEPGASETGGALGWATRGTYVPEFTAAIFDGDHKRGDIIGPVRTQFGWHVIMFEGGRPPVEEFAPQLVRQLRDGADFTALAREHTVREEAEKGGDLGWIARLQRERELEEAVFALQAGQVSEPARQASESGQGGDALVIYKAFERSNRALDPEQRAAIEESGFANWYDPKKEAAEQAGQIFRDPNAFPEEEAPQDGAPFPGGLPGGGDPGGGLPGGLPGQDPGGGFPDPAADPGGGDTP